ncbi:MAG: (4Fe-4S)-binding protein [Lachnospiraceae bacterium]|nr:(4Fe-4S)-binding protein [Lachnospiraceae bacterium]
MHRLYTNGDISIFWDSDKCYHAKKCVHRSPRTFDPARKPWIDLSQAETPEIWQAISKCPSGALTCVYNHEVKVEFDQENKRSVAYAGERQVGECDYRVTDSGWDIFHTEVIPEYSERGIAKRLVYKIVEEAERKKTSVIPSCSYAKKVLG